jgi:protein tyrosine phosphatase (PTP) superfamily phosphohydrolase (DUF442 family)
MRKAFKIIFLLIGIFVLCLLPQIFSETTSFTSYLANLVFRGNFDEVVPGRFYRTGEVDARKLAELIKKYKIKSVIDLRVNKDEVDQFGVHEREAAQANSAAYYHVPFVGSDARQRVQVEELVSLYDRVETPVILHCSSGTHRTGVASVIWLLTKENASIENAVSQLGVRYGYFYYERRLKSLIQGHQTIDALIWEYAKAQKSDGVSFRDWIKKADDHTFQ